MKRRSFLGFLGGAVVGGPKVAQSAADKLSGIGLGLGNAHGMEVASYSGYAIPPDAPLDATTFAKSALKTLLGKSEEQIAEERRRIYISNIDPDIACLRSMTLTSKIRLQRKVAHNQMQSHEEKRLREILTKGFF